jgi:hypothetical protein
MSSLNWRSLESPNSIFIFQVADDSEHFFLHLISIGKVIQNITYVMYLISYYWTSLDFRVYTYLAKERRYDGRCDFSGKNYLFSSGFRHCLIRRAIIYKYQTD